MKEFSVLQRTADRAIPVYPIFPRVKERLLHFVATIGIDLVFLIFMTALLVGAVLILDGHIRFFQASVGLPLGIMGGLILIKGLKSPRQIGTNIPIILRDWVPFLFIAFIYENLHDVAGRVMHYDIAGLMYKWDSLIFGVEPTMWMQKIFSPLLTDLMSISYALYFAFPLMIMFFLSLSGRRRAFRCMVLCLTFVFIIGFLCYVLFPCSPPRYFIRDLFNMPHRLTGIFLYNNLQGMWDGFSVIGGGAFPSLHVGISSVALIYAYKYRHFSKLYYFLWVLYIPLVTSLWVSTVYLRHHWFIDIVAGWIVAFVGHYFAGHTIQLWEKLQRRSHPSSVCMPRALSRGEESY